MARSGRFEIERELGRGGMGVVWLARDLARGGERVALKRLAAGADAEALRCEFEAARRLRHPVIVAVRDFGRDEEGAFLTMEAVEGRDLASLAGRVPPRRVAGWAVQLADALEYARRRGFLHGDLKPQNVMVPDADPDAVKLLDLGLARLAGGRAEGGTPEYLAPEILAGKDPDVRSDLFSLGCVLYESLTGRPPWQGFDRATPPAPLAAELPGPLRSTVEALLRLRPDDRPGRPCDLVVLLGDVPGRKLPLPEGDLVGRDAALAAARSGRPCFIEAEPAAGSSRLCREIAEAAESEGFSPTVAIYRPGTAPPGAPIVALGRLGAAEMERLVASRLPLEPAAARALGRWALEESGGLPALAVEALEAARAAGVLRPGPLGLECDVERLAGVRPETCEASRMAREIAALFPGERRERAARALAAAEPGQPAMLRRALIATLTPQERRFLHCAAADRALARGDDPQAAARHLLAAGRDGEAGPWLVAAAGAARSRGERRLAREFLARAAELLSPGVERGRARLDLARELKLAGQDGAALAALGEVAADAPGLAGLAHIEAAEIHAARRDAPATRAAAVAALRLARAPGGEPLRARALLVLGRLTAQRGELDVARRHLDHARCLFQASGDASGAARAGLALGNVALLDQRIDDALEAYLAARDAARAAGDARIEGLALQNLGIIYADHRRSAGEARPALEAAVAAAERDGDSPRLARALRHLAVLDFDAGRADEALRHLDRAGELRRGEGDVAGWIGDQGLRGEFLTVLGRFGEARAALEAGLARAVESGDGRAEADLLYELGRTLAELTDLAAARSHLERAVRLAAATGQRASEARARAALVRVLLDLGEAGEAQRVFAAIPRGPGEEMEVIGRVSQARAALLAATGNLAEAARALDRAVRELASSGFELELARTLLLRGDVLNRQGDPDAALDALEQARVIFDRHGARPALARTLLAKARVKLGERAG